MKYILLVIFSFSMVSFAQPLTQNARYRSAVDEGLTLNRVVLVPAYDNVSGIYSNTLNKTIYDYISSEKQWDLVLPKQAVPSRPIEDYEGDPNLVSSILTSEKADGLLVLKIIKGPAGINMRLGLFTKDGGLPANFQELKKFEGFDFLTLNRELLKLYTDLKQNLPYHGIILSRTNTQVTFNLGAKSGIRVGESLLVVQITKINRHPQFKFIVSNEKEILGKINIEKVDDTASFGTLIYEREPQLITAGNKVLLNNPIVYPGVFAGEKKLNALSDREDSNVALGDQPEEWVPSSPATFGKIGLSFGIGTFQSNASLNTSGPISGSTSLAPGMDLDAELWITPLLNIVFDMSQNIAPVSNPLPGSSPSTLNFALGRYRIGGSYNFLLSQDFFGPKIQIIGLYSTYKSFVDDSAPVAFTSMNYYGFAFGVKGSFPLPEGSPWTLGAEMYIHFSPSMAESPTNSGSNDSNTINQFGFFTTRKWRENLNFLGKLNFDYYGSDFSGTGTRGEGATSISQTLTTAKVGIEYLF